MCLFCVNLSSLGWIRRSQAQNLGGASKGFLPFPPCTIAILSMFVSAVKLLDLLYLLYFSAKLTLCYLALWCWSWNTSNHLSAFPVGSMSVCAIAGCRRETGRLEEKKRTCSACSPSTYESRSRFPHPTRPRCPPSGSCLAVFHHLQQQPHDAPFLISQPSPLELLPLVYPS